MVKQQTHLKFLQSARLYVELPVICLHLSSVVFFFFFLRPPKLDTYLNKYVLNERQY